MPVKLGMALDESLLAHLTQPVLRLYFVKPDAVSIGYSFPLKQVAQELVEWHDFARRPTGGGIVFHGDGLVFSLALPHETAVLTGDACVIHSAVVAGLRLAGLDVTLAVERGERCSLCSKSIVPWDVLLRSKKICGSARRRQATGFLIQGYVDPVLPQKELAAALLEGFARVLNTPLQPSTYTSEEWDSGQQLLRERYDTDEWIARR